MTRWFRYHRAMARQRGAARYLAWTALAGLANTLLAISVFVVFVLLRQKALDARRTAGQRTHVAWTVALGVTTGAEVVCAIGFVALAWSASLWWLGLVIAATFVLPPLGEPIIRHVLVPLGWARAAYTVGLYSWSGPDAQAYALCAAAWASRRGAAIAWVETMRNLRTPLGDGEIAATGLLAASRGDVATARALLRSLAMMVERHPAVRELAGEWLACDAAERGAWRELADDALAARGPATPLRHLLEGVALRFTEHERAPSIAGLWARWLVAPRRRATWRLVRDAVAARPPSPAATVTSDVSAPPDAAALPDAVAAHLAFETQPPTADRLAATVRAWDTALAGSDARAWLAHRAFELDAPSDAVARALADVAAAVTDQLARRAEAAQLAAPAGADGPVGHGVTRRLRHGRLDALETAFTRWAERRHTGRPSAAAPKISAPKISAIDEWREFVALSTAYRTAVTAGGLELRRLAFPHAYAKGNKMAVWLWNSCHEHAISHAISRWLLDEALAVGDTEAIELGHRNCALGVPTRLGQFVEPT